MTNRSEGGRVFLVPIHCLNCEAVVGTMVAGQQPDGTYLNISKPVHCLACQECKPEEVIVGGEIVFRIKEIEDAREQRKRGISPN